VACTSKPFDVSEEPEPVLRPLLAFATLCVAALVLAPTVASVHDGIESLDIHRTLPWQLFKWRLEPQPPTIGQPACDKKDVVLAIAVTDYPSREDKEAFFTIRGDVVAQGTSRGVPDVGVDVFLNATKAQPGDLVGHATTDAAGAFALTARAPFDLAAEHYHIVAHAIDANRNCVMLRGAWSDPEMDVTSATTIVFDSLPTVIVGHDVNVTGHVLDEVGAPVRNVVVNVTLAGRVVQAATDGEGRFVVPWHADRVGNVTAFARFTGTPYYEPSDASTTFKVVGEDLEIDGVDAAHPLPLVRSQPATIVGHVYLAPGKPYLPVTLAFQGIALSPCAGCAPRSSFTVQPDATGAFALNLTALPPADAANFTFEGSSPSLRETYPFTGTLQIPVNVTLDARNGGLFSKSYHGTVAARDETGAAAPGPLAVEGPGGWATLQPAGKGTFTFDERAPACGRSSVQALYNGTGAYAPSSQSRPVLVCGWLALLPPWLTSMPWWGWALLGLAALAAWLAARALWRRHAPTLSLGPPLRLALERAQDDGPADVVGVGEPVALAATLDAALPGGHRLRMGHHRAMTMVEPDASHVARLPLVPETRGDRQLRAEILDPRGRVVTRRTVTLHVVRYAEEIERRYRHLKRTSLGAERSDLLSPREFESWLRQRAPTDLDPLVARRLVGVFEEADYGPREAGRREFLAYLAAEMGFQRKGAGRGA
jgi:hypothetical protein